jgi:hypothetical protein
LCWEALVFSILALPATIQQFKLAKKMAKLDSLYSLPSGALLKEITNGNYECDDNEKLETEEIEAEHVMIEYIEAEPLDNSRQLSFFDESTLPEPEKVKIKIKRKTK